MTLELQLTPDPNQLSLVSFLFIFVHASTQMIELLPFFFFFKFSFSHFVLSYNNKAINAINLYAECVQSDLRLMDVMNEDMKLH